MIDLMKENIIFMVFQEGTIMILNIIHTILI